MTVLLALLAGVAAGFAAGFFAARSRSADGVQLERERLFSFIAHELNSHITGLQLTAGNLLAGAFGSLGDDQKRWIEAMDNRTDLLADIIGDLRDVSHWEFGGKVLLQPEEVDLKAIVEREFGRLRAGAGRRGVEFKVDLPKDLPKARADGYRLKRAVSSLLQNSLAFAGKGGRVVVALAAQNGSLRLTVTYRLEDGLPDMRGDVFDLRYPGLHEGQAVRVVGIGLGVAKRSLTEAGGSLVLEPAAQGENRFVLNVPFTRP